MDFLRCPIDPGSEIWYDNFNAVIDAGFKENACLYFEMEAHENPRRLEALSAGFWIPV